MPTAEEERRHNACLSEHGQVLAHLEEAELHAGVFCVVAGHDLRLAFGDIERAAVSLGDGADEVGEEGNGANRDGEDEPANAGVARAGLGGYDFLHRERACEHDGDQDGEGHWHFVADELGHGAHATEQRILIV